MGRMNYDIVKYGLKYLPDIGEDKNDLDYMPEYGYASPEIEFSLMNVDILKNAILELGENCQSILEIGCKWYIENNSTNTIEKYKPQTAKHFCVDQNPQNIENLNGENVHALCTFSSNYDGIVSFINEHGKNNIDLLFIDGWHSVNQVLDDFKYIDLLSPNGVVVLHDVAVHPGPVELLKALDENVWEISKHTDKDIFGMPNDFGIAVLKRKQPV
jgi:hypothetical protein